jgi:tetratricopeptide (TPR) repeat protein
MTDDLITALSNLSGLFVIARNSTFVYKGQAVPIKQVAEDLGVRYVLEGSVRRAGDDVRINAQLIDATTGGHLWAKRYDRRYEDIFALQDEVVGNIVSALAVNLTDAEKEQVARKPTENLEAYENYLRAEQSVNSYRYIELATALGYYQKAIALDPDFAEAHAGYARVAIEILLGLNTFLTLSADDARQRAYDSITRALALDPELPRAHIVLGLLQMLDGNNNEAIESARKAVSLDPNSAEAFANLALVLTVAGRPTESVPAMETALRLDPNPPSGFLYIWGRVLFMNGKYEQALDVLLRATKEKGVRVSSELGGARLFLAMTLAELGRVEEARSRLRKDFLVGSAHSKWMNLAFLRHHWANWRKEDLDRMLNALRMAGLPEWPTGYDTTSWERLDEAAIKDLLFGRVWIGRSQNYYDVFAQRTNESGAVEYRKFGRKREGKVSVEGDSLCYQIPALLLSRKFCGTVYRNPDGSPEERNEYVSVDVFDVHHFSLKE